MPSRLLADLTEGGTVTPGGAPASLARASETSIEVEEPTLQRGDIPSLHGLRAISIFLVLAGHANPGIKHSLASSVGIDSANLGVRVFFVISGFLITSLLLKERSRPGGISLRLFYIRRALRILPAFFLFIGCVAFLSLFGITRIPAWSWLYVLTYTVNFAPFPPFPWVLIHLWSLSVEEQFYLLWPLVMKVAKLRTSIVVAVIAVFAGPATHALEKLGGFTLQGYGPFPFACCSIAMGSLLAIWAPEARSFIVSSKLLSSGRSLVFALSLIALAGVILNHSAAQGDALQIVQNALLTFSVAWLVFIPTGWAGRALNSAPFVVVGKLSYSVYLWQELFLYKGSGKGILVLALAYALTFAAASVSYWGLEVRFLGLRKKYRNAAESAIPSM